MRKLVALTLLCTLVLAACSMPKMPRVHKIRVQQGNVITQEMIDQLKPGMTRSQVAYIMGEPVLRSTFNQRRWDYLYTVEVPGFYSNEARVSLYFENDVLAYFTGDLAPSAALEETTAATEASQDTSES